MTERASVASDGTQGNAGSDRPAISADGNIIAFISTADNLVPNDTNGVRDVFVFNRSTGVAEGYQSPTYRLVEFREMPLHIHSM